MLEQKDIEMIRNVVEEELNKHLTPIEKRFGSIDWRMGVIEPRLGVVEQRFNIVEHLLLHADRRREKDNGQLETMRADINNLREAEARLVEALQK